MTGTPRPYAVVDLDGTVADVAHRLPHLASRPKDWDAFFAAAPHDGVLPEGRAVVDRLVADHDLVWLTGRPERCRRDTERWLRRHGFPDAPVLMRREGDRRPARLTKVAALRRLASERAVDVFVDDDPAVVAAARAAGFPVLHADWAAPTEGKSSVAQQGLLFAAQEQDGRT